jgi:hypothetical protein
LFKKMWKAQIDPHFGFFWPSHYGSFWEFFRWSWCQPTSTTQNLRSIFYTMWNVSSNVAQPPWLMVNWI